MHSTSEGVKMNQQIYRGYDIKGPSETGRYYISLNGVEIYSITATEDEVYAWIDAEKRKQSAGK